MAHKLTAEQKTEQMAALCRAIDTICGSWEDAIAAADARGYPTQSPGPSAAPPLKSPHDPADPLHARTIPPARTGKGFAGDGGMLAKAARPDVAGEWLSSARRVLVVLLMCSGAEARPERRWTGPFHPPAIQAALKRAAEDVVDWWPSNVERLIQHIIALANVARREWPPTPAEGTTVQTPEGPVKVGGRADTSEVCAECGQVIGGNAIDPVRRDPDGKPFHKTPCYETERKRRQRKGAAA